MNHHPSNLTDNQWQVIEIFLDVQVRKYKYPLSSIVNAINYLLKTGCQWKMLPKNFPPCNLVYYYYLSDTLKATLGCELEAVLRPDECPSKFQVMPKRWIVERSFA